MPPLPDDDPSAPPGFRGGSDRRLLKSSLAALAAALLCFGFLKLGSEVVEGDTSSFDARLLRGAWSLTGAHPWVIEVMRDLSGLGSTIVLTLFTVLAVAYLVIVSAQRTAVLVSASIVTGTLLVSMFKSAFNRSRPDPAFADMVVTGLSFPSGHASISAMVFLTLGALMASTRSRAGERAFILASSALMALLVGVSRVALGVHWATDVAGGWALGAGWALIWWLVDRRLNRRSGMNPVGQQRAGHADRQDRRG